MFLLKKRTSDEGKNCSVAHSRENGVSMAYPKIIQGGMGIAVSSWRLSRSVSMLGQLGVVSGTALDSVLARRLQMGDVGGHIQRAFEHFPYPDIAKRVWSEFFIQGGKVEGDAFKPVPMYTQNPPRSLLELTVLANFTEVFLAREGDSGLIGINFLEKIQMPTLPSVFGAMLAGVAFVLMGAGIPRAIPGILDDLSAGKPVKLRLDVEGALPGDEYACHFDPAEFCGGKAPALERPKFLAIVSSATLAITLARKASGNVDGFVVEGVTAGGHNAPPRGPMQLTEFGEPIYGERDVPDLTKIAAIGLPFWLAGSFGQPGKLQEALDLGAAGIQVGTAFAFCEESGIDPELKRSVLETSRAGRLRVFTDPLASPTGFPFKVVQFEKGLAAAQDYANRTRVCDLGYLRHPYRKPDGTLGYRCSAEPVAAYVKKGGTISETDGRKCLCNALMANVSLAQTISGAQGGRKENPLLTAGDEAVNLFEFLKPGANSYTAAEVVERLTMTC